MSATSQETMLPVGSVTERAVARQMHTTGHSIFVISSYLGTTSERVRRMLAP